MTKNKVMNALTYIVNKFNIDLTQKSPFYLPISSKTDIPEMFKELGFKIGAEVGVCRGAYAEILSKAIPNLNLYGIDMWEVYEGYRDFSNNEILTKIHELAIEKTKNFNCRLIKNWSNEAVKQFKDESLDFVYIDANHAYEYVVEDIAKWSKKVRRGGVVYGHDFDDYSQTKRKFEVNVINAVTGWCNSYQIHPWFVIANDKHKGWMYVK
jgi:hypothetical protein